ncbi:hypothetical protein ES703_38177 [subsurface metagenome]
MIWFRRIIVLPLALTFIILSILLLVTFRVNDTLGNPDFYNDQLRQADTYNFIYDDVLPVALEEVDIGGETSGVGINIKPHIIDIVGQTLPPEWLQTQVEQSINQVVPYVWGDTEGFKVDIPLKDRVEAAAQAAKNTLHKEEVFPVLYDQAIGLILDEITPDMEEMPPPFTLTRDEMAPILRTVLPAEWVLMQIDSAIDEVVPYFTKDKAQFTVRVDISDRLAALEVVVADILKRPETYDYLFEGVMAPAIKQNTQEITSLPIGVALTDEEILLVVKETLSLEWYQARVTDIVGQIFAYLGGTEENLDVVIPLAERKPAMAKALGKLADQKLESLIDSLPVCTTGQLIDLLMNPPLDSLPECRPIDITYRELKGLLGIDISIIIAPFVDMWIPDQWVLSDAELRQAFGGEGDEDFLNQARELVQEGLTYTDEDLRADLGVDYETIEDIRQRIADGFIFTEKELRDGMRGLGDEQLQTFESVRSGLGTARQWRLAAWLIPALMLLAVGALGGRRWRDKLLWAAAVLAMMAIIAYVIFGPLFSAMVQPRIDEALIPAVGQAEGLQALMTGKGITIAQNAIASFVGGLKAQALGLLVVSLLFVGVGVFWPIWPRIWTRIWPVWTRIRTRIRRA